MLLLELPGAPAAIQRRLFQLYLQLGVTERKGVVPVRDETWWNWPENEPREHLDTVASISFQEFPGVMGVGRVNSMRIEKIGNLRLWRQGKSTPLPGEKVTILPLGDVED